MKSSGLLGHKQHPNLIYWLHQISNLTMLAFAALSPYLYVFRSRKVQKCLGQVIYDTFCCCGKAAKSGFSRPQCVIFAKLKSRNIVGCFSGRNSDMNFDMNWWHQLFWREFWLEKRIIFKFFFQNSCQKSRQHQNVSIITIGISVKKADGAFI